MTVLRPLVLIGLVCIAPAMGSARQDTSTYAEKLGWPKGTRALILHVDDVGMSYNTELGTIEAIEKGVANSLSVMMPTPWVPHAVEWIKTARPDAGLHLTLTSEWKSYRWGPVAGKPAVPGLVDPQGALWPNVASVVKHATADEVEREIRAQLDRARTMGFEPTHMDSHMGTLFATDAFIERYVKVGIEQKIPVMFPGGHNFYHLAVQSGAGCGGARNRPADLGRRAARARRPPQRQLRLEDRGQGGPLHRRRARAQAWGHDDDHALHAAHGGLRADFQLRHDPPRRPQGDAGSAPAEGPRGRAHRAHDLARADGAAHGRFGVPKLGS